MTELTPAEVLGRAADLIVDPLRDFVEITPPRTAPTWPQHFELQDRRDGRQRTYSMNDPRLLFKILVFEWKQLDGRVQPLHSAWAREIHSVLNTTAHERSSLQPTVAVRCIETMALLSQELFPEWRGRTELEELAHALLPPSGSEAARMTSPTPASTTHGPAAEPPTAEAVRERSVATHAASDTQPTSHQAPPSQQHEQAVDQPDVSHELVDDLPDGTGAGMTHEAGDNQTNIKAGPHLPPGYREVRLVVGPVRITVRYVESLNYAVACQGIPPVESLLLENTNQAESATVDLLSLDIDGISLEDSGSHLGTLSLGPGEAKPMDSSSLAWPIDHRAFANLDEARPGHLRVSASVNGDLRSTRGELRLLAHDEWAFSPRPELISAFVSPNDAEIAPLLKQVSDLLRERTGDPSLTSYESGLDRVTAVVDALYDTLQAHQLTLAERRESYEVRGERVRRPNRVLAEGVGSTLDLSVLFASTLEAIGINPIVVLTRTRHLAGFLVEEFSLSQLAVSSQSELQTLVRSGMVVPVDISCVTSDVSRLDATQSTEHFWDLDSDDVIAMIDVAASRRRIRPLPTVSRTDDGSLIIESERPAPLPLPSARRTLEATASASTSSAPPRVERWRRSLLDLSFRNPLLKLGRTSGEQLHVPEHAIAMFEDMLASGKPLRIRAGLDLDPVTNQGTSSILHLEEASVARILADEHAVYALKSEATLGRALDRLRRKATTIQEETGNNNLFVTLGALRWKDNRGNDALAPLFLLPVKLEGRSQSSYRLRLAGDEVALPNFCLIQKLRRDHDFELPLLENPPRDDSGIDMAVTFQALREALVLANKPFAVDAHVRLAVLQFATLEMWRDVSDNWARLAENPVVRHLVETPTQTFEDPVPEPPLTTSTEAEEHLLVPSDGAQLKAVRWAREGRTFVLEGPPGTGKSQTITNMIADSLAHGRKVLFVAEKQAALDVVRRRLDTNGLSPLTLDLHGRDLTIRRVRQQLENAWEHAVTPASTYLQLRQQVATQVHDLSDYRRRLHGEGPAGMSLWQAHDQVLRVGSQSGLTFKVPRPIVRGEVPAREVTERLERALRALRDLGGSLASSTWALIDAGDQTVDEPALERAVSLLDNAVRGLSPQGRALMAGTEPAAWPHVATALEIMSHDVNIMSPQTQQHADTWARDLQNLAGQLDDFAARHDAFRQLLAPAAGRADVPHLRARLAEAQESGPLRRKRLIRAVNEQVQALTMTNNLPAREMHPFLNSLEQYQSEGRALFQAMGRFIPTGTTVEEGGEEARLLAERLIAARRARKSITSPERLEQYRQVVAHGGVDASRDARCVRELVDGWQATRQILGSGASAVDRWRSGRSTFDALVESIPAWIELTSSGRFGSLRRARLAANELAGLRELCLDELAHGLETGAIEIEGLHARVNARLAEATQDERLDTTGLDQFVHSTRERLVHELTATTSAARQEAALALPGIVRAGKNITPTRPSHELGALRREFQRKRGGSIRELVAQHASVLFKLTPCVLMSPASVARYLPADIEKFDLVIFDEASQIRVADAVGALGRAHAAVIVGDSQQMPPTSMFSASDDVDDEVDDALTEGVIVPQDQDSILKECVDSNLERLWLTWHYRSQDESLIAFSNSAYYKGALASFPTPPRVSSSMGKTAQAAVSLRNVQGTFDGGHSGSRTNDREAKKIVAEVERLLRDDAGASVGVITFNAQQQALLADMLESMGGRIREAMNRDIDPLFVKNLENVQGDERDVVLFSLAFSPTGDTGRLRLNFGPLTREGGEKRLNVAITRARRSIILFSSFEPEHLDLSRTSSVGLRHLRAYMEYARGDQMALAQSSSAMRPDRHRQEVVSALRDAGLDVQESIGLSEFKVDLAVRRPGNGAWIAVLLDGEEWARRTTVGDRDILPAAVLSSSMGWPRVEHVWLPEWILDQDTCVRRLVAAADAANDAEAGTTPARDASSVQDVPESSPAASGAPQAAELDSTEAVPHHRVGEPERPAPTHAQPEVTSSPALSEAPAHPEDASIVNATEPRDCVTPQPNTHSAETRECSRIVCKTDLDVIAFTPFTDQSLIESGALDRLDDDASRKRVIERIDEIIGIEAPIESWRLARLVGRSFGVHSVRQHRHDAILTLVERSQRQAEGETEFVWPAAMIPDDYHLARRDSTADRTIFQISRVEIGNAMLTILKDNRGEMPSASLRRETMALFGFRREGAHIADRLDQTLQWLIRNGKVNIRGDVAQTT